jgi:hypothetical protein
MTRQNLLSGAWDGDNEEEGTRHRIFWRPDDARMGQRCTSWLPTRRGRGCIRTSEPKRCSSS